MANSTINPLANPTTGISANQTVNTNTANNSSSIDPNAFLKMFVQEMQNQDPLEPMSNSDMMGQLTQLTQIQNTENMKSILENLSSTIQGQNPIGNYLGLIGKQVKVQTNNGTQDGKVLSVGKEGSNVLFEMENGNYFNVSDIVGVSDY